ncbi:MULTISPECIES: hypothetical protein [Komagataeibacter]|uniref:Uncharacterized protein n=1 Tax=Komagataeibacter oboediens TaxID=65958 RepID=A0ABS5SLZ8_9PROT|nr:MULTISPECIES: hypothetical protein [Komagataeibacter]MBL7232584.1 hypothetical protein [Komagataeibacter oboediens]MBT0675241.1 hypothetical protein [Komagataeibacter oboediens]MBT0678852.1 hypothetical protein [Komagataeibacter oboediens]MBV1822999.1 hypothetical protein [Komagataeibacter oboediens]WEQ51408.1 hypothetical protein LV478_12850 [Komagataeibacter oboediens]
MPGHEHMERVAVDAHDRGRPAWRCRGRRDFARQSHQGGRCHVTLSPYSILIMLFSES